mgnify:CR=1 FL=1
MVGRGQKFRAISDRLATTAGTLKLAEQSGGHDCGRAALQYFKTGRCCIPEHLQVNPRVDRSLQGRRPND